MFASYLIGPETVEFCLQYGPNSFLQSFTFSAPRNTNTGSFSATGKKTYRVNCCHVLHPCNAQKIWGRVCFAPG